MKDANITTSVDVKVNHGDMIEMMVEEQIESLENHLSELKAQFNELEMKESELKAQIDEQLIKDLKIDKRPELKPLYEAAKKLGLEVAASANVKWYSVKERRSHGLSHMELLLTEGIIFDKDYQPSLRNISGSRSAMREFKALMSQRQSLNSMGLSMHYLSTQGYGTKLYGYSRVKSVSTGFSASSTEDGATDVVLTKKGEEIQFKDIKLSAKTKKMFDKLDDLAQRAAAIDKEQYEVEIQLFELEHAPKRHKAKFLKAMLSSSDTGQELLKLMKGVGGTNLIEIKPKE